MNAHHTHQPCNNSQSDFYTKEFTYGKAKISRKDLESLGSPFCTKDVTEKTMHQITPFTSKALENWNLEK